MESQLLDLRLGGVGGPGGVVEPGGGVGGPGGPGGDGGAARALVDMTASRQVVMRR